MDDFEKSVGQIVAVVCLLLVALWAAWLFVGPNYNVWASSKAGQAELSRAEFNRQIAVRESQAKLDAATNLAQAEIKRAEGVAKANKIIGTSLKGNDAYLRYLWIDKINGDNKEVIYVPTEANIPILEAGKSVNKPAQ